MIPSSSKRRPPGAAGPRAWIARGALIAGLVLCGPAWDALADLTSMGGGGSESVGSLPSTKGPGPGLGGHTSVNQPFGLTLTGSEHQLRALVVDARGAGSYEFSALDAPGLFRLAFHGEVAVALDRAALERSFVSAACEIGPSFQGGLAHVVAGKRASTIPLGAGPIDLHLQQLSWSGLAAGGVDLVAVTPERTASRLRIQTRGDMVVLIQTP